MTGLKEHFGDEVETQFNGNSMESMRVTLVKVSSNGDTKPEPAMLCNQARPQVEGSGHQPNHMPAGCVRSGA